MDMEEQTCPICYEKLNESETVITVCNHKFHKKCINTWKSFQRRDKRTCPICRTRLSIRPIDINTPLYNINYISIMAMLIIVYFIIQQFREEIHDNGACQWDAKEWCSSRGYTWFKSENNGQLCNTDYCYRYVF